MQFLKKSRHGFVWVTLAFFLVTAVGHWVFAWYAYVNEAAEHGAQVVASDYLVEVMRDMLENWQSEFLQLIWQVAGLAFLLHIGSPQSREGDERKEELLDEILRAVKPGEAEAIIARLEERFPKS
jgi:hypothetical protein